MKKHRISIKTKLVFTKNDQIFLKQEQHKSEDSEWNLINFQWIPI